MVGIVYKSTAPIMFQLKGKSIELKAEGIINIVSEEDYTQLMNLYGNFIKKRTFSESNPLGCFVIGKNEEYAKDMSEEIGEVKDASAPIEVEQPKIEEEKPIEVKEEVKDASAPQKRNKRKK